MSLWKRLFRAAGLTAAPPQVPPNMRVYAVGDIHGRADLLEDLLAIIHHDCRGAPDLRVVKVFLGDLIDRGPDSATVVERLHSMSLAGDNVHCLTGNHEEALLRVVNGEPGWLARWLGFGGKACANSYGIDPRLLAQANDIKGAELLSNKIPSSHLAFLRSFHDMITIGDYLFVHAGIRPGVPIVGQTPADLRWIREPFLSDRTPHGMVVVHGHTALEQPEDHGNRVGIDTGAYYSGRLTALVLEGTTRRYLGTKRSLPAAGDLDLPGVMSPPRLRSRRE